MTTSGLSVSAPVARAPVRIVRSDQAPGRRGGDEMAAGGTATATVLFTDVVGSTEVRADLGEAAADALFVEHHRQLGQIVSRHGGDRKSTRLNSSHLGISYAVFCLK